MFELNLFLPDTVYILHSEVTHVQCRMIYTPQQNDYGTYLSIWYDSTPNNSLDNGINVIVLFTEYSANELYFE